MIRHVALFKVKQNVSREERDRWIEMSRLAHSRIGFTFSCKIPRFRSGAEGIRTPDLRRAKAALLERSELIEGC